MTVNGVLGFMSMSTKRKCHGKGGFSYSGMQNSTDYWSHLVPRGKGSNR